MSDETTQDPKDKPADQTAGQTQDQTAEQAAVEEVFAEAAEAAAAAPGDPIAALKAEVADSQRRVLMAQADLENYRKRARRDAEDGIKYAALPLIRELLPCIDNLQRAIEAQEQADVADGAPMLEGVKMVSQQLSNILAQHHCKIIDGTGEFDPNIHEALLQQPSAEYPAGTVMQVTQTGYQLHDRVIRPAQVIVSKGPA